LLTSVLGYVVMYRLKKDNERLWGVSKGLYRETPDQD